MINRRMVRAGLALAPLAKAARAKNFPSGPVRMLVGFAPGGGDDVVARLMGPHLALEMGQPIVVENRPGTGGNVVTKYLATEAKPDGKTILMGTIAALAINPGIYQDKLGFDPEKDLTPITNAADSCNILVVPRDSKFQSTKELVAAMKTATLSCVSSGIGTAGHLAEAMFGMIIGTIDPALKH